MKKSKFTESQIIKALKENDQGRKTDDLCGEMGIHKGITIGGRSTLVWMRVN